MYNIIVFENKRFGNIRTFGEEGKQEPWFVAADVCRALEVKNARDAVARLDDDEKNTAVLTDGNRGNPNVTVVSEPPRRRESIHDVREQNSSGSYTAGLRSCAGCGNVHEGAERRCSMVERQDWLNALTICPVCNAMMKRYTTIDVQGGAWVKCTNPECGLHGVLFMPM